MAATKIEWCDKVWNPITGCNHAGSPGCDHCYAKRMASRLKGRYGYPEDDPFKVTFHIDRFGDPYKWKRPQRIFVCSMGDYFHENVDISWQSEVYDSILDLDRHTYLFLTKRPENIWRPDILGENVWFGTTVENQEMAEERIPLLIRGGRGWHKLFVSCEPLLGPIDLSPWIKNIDWVIVGSETGTGARPLRSEWVREISEQCKEYGIPYFYKNEQAMGYDSGMTRRELPTPPKEDA